MNGVENIKRRQRVRSDSVVNGATDNDNDDDDDVEWVMAMKRPC